MPQKISHLCNNMISNFLFRMMISGVLLSACWGWMVYIYQIDQVKKALFRQLEKTSQSIVKKITVPLDKIDNVAFGTFINLYHQQRTDFRIVMLDIYGINNHRVFHYQRDLKGIETGIRITDPPFSKQPEYSMLKLQGDFYFKTFISVYNGKQYLGAMDIMVVVGQRSVRQFRKALIFAILHATGTTVTMTLVLYPLIYTSYRKLQRNRRELLKSHLQTIKALGNAIAERDSDTDEHNYRVTYFSIGLAERLNLSDPLMRSLVKGAFLHDIGKIGIRDNILLKTSGLSSDEIVIMRTHVEQGVKIVANIPWLEDAIAVIRFHHERYDGSGYPSGMRGEQIPMVARIFAVVDVFDALISKRPYKPALSYDHAIKTLKQDSREFDPLVFAAFLEISEWQYNDVIAMGKTDLETYLVKKVSNYFEL